MAWRIASAKPASVCGLRANPTTENFSGWSPCRNRLYTAGISLRFVRSPEAPKITSMNGSGTASRRRGVSFSPFFLSSALIGGSRDSRPSSFQLLHRLDHRGVIRLVARFP